MGKKRVKQDHWNYTLRNRRRIVKHGITTNPERRAIQMENAGLRFTSMIIDSVVVSKETALR